MEKYSRSSIESPIYLTNTNTNNEGACAPADVRRLNETF